MENGAAEMNALQKLHRFLEEPQVRWLLLFTAIALCGLLSVLLIAVKERKFWRKYRAKLSEETNAELERLAYTDLVTGAYNRNRFELEKEKVDMEHLYALFSVSVDHQDYIRSKYGGFYFEDILRKAADTIRECSPGQPALYRVFENVFYFWCEQPVKLETYVAELKARFAAQSENGVPLSLSVGAVYNNTVDKEKIGDLIDRCEKMRLLDERHAEAGFIENKMKLL